MTVFPVVCGDCLWEEFLFGYCKLEELAPETATHLPLFVGTGSTQN